MRRTRYRRERRCERAPHALEGHLGGTPRQADNHVKSRMRHQDRGDRGAQPSTGPIPAHSPGGAGHSEGDARRGRFPGKRTDSNRPGARLAPGFPHRRNSASPGKAMPPVHLAGAGVQALATLATACLEDLAAARRRHAYAKAVRLAPVALLGLVRPLDSRLSETWIASGALAAPLSPTGLLREYIKAAGGHPPFPGVAPARSQDGGALAPLVTGAVHC